MVASLLPDGNFHLINTFVNDYQRFITLNQANEDLREKLFPGMVELIEKLHNKKTILAVITAKSRQGLNYTLTHNHIQHYFTATYTVDDGVMKPDATLLKQTMRESGASPKHCVMIGDTRADMEMAKNGDAIGVGVNWGSHDSKQLLDAGAEIVVDNTEAIYHYLMKLWDLPNESPK